MAILHCITLVLACAAGLLAKKCRASDSTSLPLKAYTNPILPGYHPDPTCTSVHGTVYCATSSFVTFPGLPIYASRDLQNWKLVSHAFNRKEQLPTFNDIGSSQGGVYAPTLRFYGGNFYLAVTVIGPNLGNYIFTTRNICNDEDWGIPEKFDGPSYDPDLFIDKDGTAYTHSAKEDNKGDHGILQATLNLSTGKIGPIARPWNGTGGIYPEGPHIYLKDDEYFLMNAEGGTDLGHEEVIARAQSIAGPYIGNPKNPILTNKQSQQYFQGVGHADLFDLNGQWWGVALAKRSGPAYKYYPMNRETSLYPVSWPAGEYPVLDQVRGRMRGPLPAIDKELACAGPDWIDRDDAYEFGDTIPKHFTTYGIPAAQTYTVRKGMLVVTPLVAANDTKLGSVTFIGRRQMHSLFHFSASVDFEPAEDDDEAGLSVFLDPQQRIDVGIIKTQDGRVLRLGTRQGDSTPKELSRRSLPLQGSVNIIIRAINQTHYVIASSLRSSDTPSREVLLGYATSDVVSKGFTGSFVGAYARGSSAKQVTVRQWRYIGQGQIIG